MAYSVHGTVRQKRRREHEAEEAQGVGANQPRGGVQREANDRHDAKNGYRGDRGGRRETAEAAADRCTRGAI